MRGMIFAAGLAAALAGGAMAGEPRTAVFAGGCFWCVEADFDKVPGVLATVSGYTGGTVENPSYKQVTFGETGHYEAVEVTYDPDRVGYRQLADIFWRTVDPTDSGGQFCDRGDSYRTAVFVADEEQRQAAQSSKAEAAAVLGQEVVTPILDMGAFWPAEDYHQGYYEKNPLRYRYYRWNCGRDQRIEELWGDAAHQGLGT